MSLTTMCSPDHPDAAAPLQHAGEVRDSLLDCLLHMCRHHGVARSAEALCAGLPRHKALLPSVAVQALSNAGFGATIARRSADQLADVLLPVILLREDGGACMLLGTQRDDGEAVRHSVLLPEMGAAPVVLEAAELQALHNGHVILVKPLATICAGTPDAVEDSAGHWLRASLWRYRRHYANAVLGAVIINVLALAGTFFTMNVYDRVVPHQALVTLWSLAVGVVLAMVMECVARHVRAHLLDQAGKKVDLVAGAILFRQALAIRMEHKPASAGAFAAQLREFESLRDFATAATLSVVTDLPFVFLFIALGFFIGGPLGLVPLLALPLTVLLSVAVQGPLARAMRANLRESADKQGLLIESMEALETVKALSAQSQLQKRWEAMSALSAAGALKVRGLSSLALNGVNLVQQLQTVVIIVWGVYLIGDGRLSQGALIGAVILAGRAAAPLAQLAGLAVRFQQARAAMQVLDALMRTPLERHAHLQRRYLDIPVLSGQISLRDVSFAYPAPSGDGRRTPSVLDGINLEIGAGERVAILGPIGSGKSSLLRLMARLYQPGGGQLLADGLESSQIDPADWRAAIGYVGQECRLFRGSLRQNIVIGRPLASDQELLAVLELVGLDLLVKMHPLGLDLQVGEHGQALSAGQRQLVALARGLLARPRLLLLDEPTSAMDGQSEARFISRLGQVVQSQSQALVLVTHRHALLALVERIVVLDAGRVVADGPRQAVLAALAGNAVPTNMARARQS